jgi:hypothetical protein
MHPEFAKIMARQHYESMPRQKAPSGRPLARRRPGWRVSLIVIIYRPVNGPA